VFKKSSKLGIAVERDSYDRLAEYILVVFGNRSYNSAKTTAAFGLLRDVEGHKHDLNISKFQRIFFERVKISPSVDEWGCHRTYQQDGDMVDLATAVQSHQKFPRILYDVVTSELYHAVDSGRS